jgi:Mrp family chromosome partitioning ATPase
MRIRLVWRTAYVHSQDAGSFHAGEENDMTARTLIVAMPKGGSGKTATSVAFAWGLHRAGRRVLVVDLDPQGNATAALGVDA